MEADEAVLRAELAFTIPLLVEFPKCYWIWNHRTWALDETVVRLPVESARRIWLEELGLVGKMLTRDRRNFHAWAYRRFVVARLESAELGGTSMVESEFEYTTRMINVDLSNMSAWHRRSTLIPRLLDERGADDETRKNFLVEGQATPRCLICVSEPCLTFPVSQSSVSSTKHSMCRPRTSPSGSTTHS